jgi:hypothetical protein
MTVSVRFAVEHLFKLDQSLKFTLTNQAETNFIY